MDPFLRCVPRVQSLAQVLSITAFKIQISSQTIKNMYKFKFKYSWSTLHLKYKEYKNKATLIKIEKTPPMIVLWVSPF